MRFFDVAAVGVTVGAALVFSGAPGGWLFSAATSLWRVKPGEDASAAGALAQVTLTVWALLVSLAGATYIEVARTVRSDARARLELLMAGAHAYQQGRPISDELVGRLHVIALDTPPLKPYFAASAPLLEVLQRHYDLVNDYWSMRSGYDTGARHSRSLAERLAARSQSKQVLVWRSVAAVFAAGGVVALLLLGWQSLTWEASVIGAGACAHQGRIILLGRGVA